MTNSLDECHQRMRAFTVSQFTVLFLRGTPLQEIDFIYNYLYNYIYINIY